MVKVVINGQELALDPIEDIRQQLGDCVYAFATLRVDSARELMELNMEYEKIAQVVNAIHSQHLRKQILIEIFKVVGELLIKQLQQGLIDEYAAKERLVPLLRLDQAVEFMTEQFTHALSPDSALDQGERDFWITIQRIIVER